MSKQTWAPIVYGRSYYLDFRFITLPDDFGDRELAWVSAHILATTQKARNLSQHPRWSLFKNNTHCAIGVTCMVRDLIGQLGSDSSEIMAKDEHGRPLYVFVGYVTKLEGTTALADFPGYMGTNLTSFQPLYRELEPVWLAHDYDNRKPVLSSYKPLSIEVETGDLPEIDPMSPFNSAVRYPDKTFVWPRSPWQNNQLWLASAQCTEPTSVCLDIQGKQLVDSPFFNQTITKIEQFRVCDRFASPNETSTSNSEIESPKQSTLKQKISTKARKDIDLTLQQAAKVTSASQEIINSFASKGDRNSAFSEQLNKSLEDTENFGVKIKKADSPTEDKDWF